MQSIKEIVEELALNSLLPRFPAAASEVAA
jgi:hypothetical protein